MSVFPLFFLKKISYQTKHIEFYIQKHKMMTHGWILIYEFKYLAFLVIVMMNWSMLSWTEELIYLHLLQTTTTICYNFTLYFLYYMRKIHSIKNIHLFVTTLLYTFHLLFRIFMSFYIRLFSFPLLTKQEEEKYFNFSFLSFSLLSNS